ncbi:hypothetical protein MYCTH_2125234 [Thermothelomyces thermophilus ATCC 42464]|uniref:Uncharacterized protein n=1 Tax=Thermothelomyces thermophilus (strain ATCC 42464 / BCRC 31852 / DSM 1799) TaxID=573729 RepID=G2Q8S7_THET4|nr:uncharacterized protein MYCTH_2125234 [Thermothelomyces thermophilus ATCC 42464]AEO56272.1 hypothetical protein MYCTH_2125234 [Thermothelomyces thermophilus ATCC 42464]
MLGLFEGALGIYGQALQPGRIHNTRVTRLSDGEAQPTSDARLMNNMGAQEIDCGKREGELRAAKRTSTYHSCLMSRRCEEACCPTVGSGIHEQAGNGANRPPIGQYSQCRSERASDDEPGTPPFGGTVAPMKSRVCPYCALRLWSIEAHFIGIGSEGGEQ